jgi:hypothetical protein
MSRTIAAAGYFVAATLLAAGFRMATFGFPGLAVACSLFATLAVAAGASHVNRGRDGT